MISTRVYRLRKWIREKLYVMLEAMTNEMKWKHRWSININQDLSENGQIFKWSN